jgi:PTH1 family peptidyl-tRNA hydrolase
MKVIIGFGNPGTQYNWTRHNSGFLALDFYAKCEKLEWQDRPKFFCHAVKDEAHDLLLVKAQTFYNEVGRSARAIMNFYKLQPSDFLIICDDFNLEFGKLRFREKGSAGGNNGLKSCIAELGTEEFPRLRIGTANDELRRKTGDVDFVLSKFTPEEKEKLPKILGEIRDFIAKY